MKSIFSSLIFASIFVGRTLAAPSGDLICPPENPLTILTWGYMGTGKSTLINRILGENLAMVSAGSQSCTSNVTLYPKDGPKYFERLKCYIRLIDIEGFQYDEGKSQGISAETINQLSEQLGAGSRDGIHVHIHTRVAEREEGMKLRAFQTVFRQFFNLSDGEVMQRGLLARTKAENIQRHEEEYLMDDLIDHARNCSGDEIGNIFQAFRDNENYVYLRQTYGSMGVPNYGAASTDIMLLLEKAVGIYKKFKGQRYLTSHMQEANQEHAILMKEIEELDKASSFKNMELIGINSIKQELMTSPFVLKALERVENLELRERLASIESQYDSFEPQYSRFYSKIIGTNPAKVIEELQKSLQVMDSLQSSISDISSQLSSFLDESQKAMLKAMIILKESQARLESAASMLEPYDTAELNSYKQALSELGQEAAALISDSKNPDDMESLTIRIDETVFEAKQSWFKIDSAQKYEDLQNKTSVIREAIDEQSNRFSMVMANISHFLTNNEACVECNHERLSQQYEKTKALKEEFDLLVTSHSDILNDDPVKFESLGEEAALATKDDIDETIAKFNEIVMGVLEQLAEINEQTFRIKNSLDIFTLQVQVFIGSAQDAFKRNKEFNKQKKALQDEQAEILEKVKKEAEDARKQAEDARKQAEDAKAKVATQVQSSTNNQGSGGGLITKLGKFLFG